jgi:hypothetical protein
MAKEEVGQLGFGLEQNKFILPEVIQPNILDLGSPVIESPDDSTLPEVRRNQLDQKLNGKPGLLENVKEDIEDRNSLYRR